MRIATWNVARVQPRSRTRWHAIRSWLEDVDADVWVLTETHEALSPGAGYAGTHTLGQDRPGDAGERWVGLWSRYPLGPAGPVRDPVRTAAAVVTPPTGRPLLVVGAVLPWLGSPWRDYGAASGTAFDAALSALAADCIDLQSRHPGADLCLAGDLNQDLSDRHFYGSRDNRHALREVLTGLGLAAATADPHDPVRAAAPERASVDHLCVPQGWMGGVPTTMRVWPQVPEPDRRLSDHFGVALDIPR